LNIEVALRKADRFSGADDAVRRGLSGSELSPFRGLSTSCRGVSDGISERGSGITIGLSRGLSLNRRMMSIGLRRSILAWTVALLGGLSLSFGNSGKFGLSELGLSAFGLSVARGLFFKLPKRPALGTWRVGGEERCMVAEEPNAGKAGASTEGGVAGEG
jgi:hypothetical protein